MTVDAGTRLSDLALDGLGTAAHVLVSKDGQLVVDETKDAAPDARYFLFSLSKPVTASALFTLVDAGELALDTPVAQVIPAFAAGGKETVTVAEVLSHSAGFPIYLSEADGGQPLGVDDFADWDHAVDLICRMPLTPEWRGLGLYHGLSFAILGRVAERISGLDFNAFCRQALWDPLGMEETSFGLAPEVQAKATGIAGIHAAGWNEELLRHTILPAGNCWSTAPDVMRLFEMLRNGGTFEGRRVLSEAVIAEATRLWVPNVNSVWGMGLGFFVGAKGPVFARGTRSAIRSFGHSGAMGTQAFHDPENDITIVALTNSTNTQEVSDARFDRLCDEIYARFVDREIATT
jgi:CubicO group peptidase (beta-lactamase class C family)